MYDEPKLSEAEWRLVIELLECERDELPSEIHHTRVSDVRRELQQRGDMVRGMLERLSPMMAAH